jgi:hypothetical protein
MATEMVCHVRRTLLAVGLTGPALERRPVNPTLASTLFQNTKSRLAAITNTNLPLNQAATLNGRLYNTASVML